MNNPSTQLTTLKSNRPFRLMVNWAIDTKGMRVSLRKRKDWLSKHQEMKEKLDKVWKDHYEKS